MYVIDARNVNDAFVLGMQALAQHGDNQPSRYGDTIEMPEPVCTIYNKPTERVLFDPQRDANPFFHLMESLWMLSGRHDVEWLSQFSKKISEFSDNGFDFHGAYGWRWRKHFGFDQLEAVVHELRRDPDNRRVVLQMWDPNADLAQTGKDFPCNTAVYFKVRHGKLNMLVTNRSNDAIWGCYGANAVHFSILMEYVAAAVGVPVGVYRQVSDSLHAYKETWHQAEGALSGISPCSYSLGTVSPTPLVTHPESFMDELEAFMYITSGFGKIGPPKNEFLSSTAFTAFASWTHWKNKDLDRALKCAESVEALDWRQAMVEWLQRRAK